MTMRLAIVHPHLDVRGGSERLTKIFVEELQEKFDIEFKIFTARIDVEWFSKLMDRVVIYRDIDDFRDKLLSFDPDNVYVALVDSYYCYVSKTAKPSIVASMYIHFPYDEEIDLRNIDVYVKYHRYPHLVFKYISYIDKSFANSMRTAMVTQFVWGLKPIVVYPCIDRIFFDEDIDLSLYRDNTVLYVARFTPLKRADALLLMFKLIKEEVPNARLVIAGFEDLRHREYLDHVLSVADTIPDVEVVVSPSDRQLIKLYREAKVYVHPRVGEHFGISPIEAMSQGVPIVVRTPSGIGEVVQHGLQGFLAQSDFEMLRYTVKVLRMNSSEWIEFSKRAYRKAQEFRPEIFTKRIIENLM